MRVLRVQRRPDETEQVQRRADSGDRQRRRSRNGPEFAGRTLEAWAYAAKVTLCFIRPGKPIENAYVESFNGKFRDECLNEHWFVSLADAQAQIEAWRVDYNTVRPHSALDDQTPHQFAASTEGARRPRPARLNEDQKPAELSV
jgi:transposase InsO family protein